MIEEKHTSYALKQLLHILGHTVTEAASSYTFKVTLSSKKIFCVINVGGLVYYKEVSDECSDFDESNIDYSHPNQHYKKTSFFYILLCKREKVMEHIVKSIRPKLIDQYKNVSPIIDANIEILVSPMLERRLENCMTTDIPENLFIDELISDAFELVKQKFEQDRF